MFLQVLDALLGLDVGPEVLVRLVTVTLRLTVLADHDERRGVRSLKRKR